MMADSLRVFTALPWTDRDRQLGKLFTMTVCFGKSPDSVLQDGSGQWAISCIHLYSF